jgi:hypothetical protein
MTRLGEELDGAPLAPTHAVLLAIGHWPSAIGHRPWGFGMSVAMRMGAIQGEADEVFGGQGRREATGNPPVVELWRHRVVESPSRRVVEGRPAP